MSQALRARVRSFDNRIDGALERVRGRSKVVDRVFLTASVLGDFSLVWHMVGAARGLTSDSHANQAYVFSAVIAIESLLVNQGIKRLFRRTRPTTSGDTRFRVRTPSSTSFPSGHSSAAFCAATLLTYWSGLATAPAWFALATIVAVSRAYVRIHHASDVVAGTALGLMLGEIAVLVIRAV